ncbi:hypothetical protein BX616_004229 [Lobosporangium transversale]|nr:hypothetical protein BX616_004229 [Lobosporangium transversale]
MTTPTTSTTTALAPSAAHLQLLLQQHHALQRKEQEAKERLEREKQQLKQQEQNTAMAPTSSTVPAASSLKADAQSVAAYMAAYMRLVSTRSIDQVNSANEAAGQLTVDPVQTSFDTTFSSIVATTSADKTTASPATIAPSSTVLYPSPPPSVVSSFTQKSSSTKPFKPHGKKLSSDAAVAAESSVDTATATFDPLSTTGSKSQLHHRQECYNCGVTKTPLWRRTQDRKHSLCNACGLYFKQYKTNRPIAGRTSTESVVVQQQPQQQLLAGQQTKRRKINDAADTTISVKSEPTDLSQQQQQQQQKQRLPEQRATNTSHLKPLLPHPSSSRHVTQIGRSQTIDSHSFDRHGTIAIHDESKLASESEADDEGGGEMDQDEIDEDDMVEAHRSNIKEDVEMADERSTREMSDSDNDNSDDSDCSDRNQEEIEDYASKSFTTDKPTPPRPAVQSKPGSVNSKATANANIECANCGQTQTPLWRKDAKGQSICNACGLYARLHQRDRPVTMRKTKIARRKRDWKASQEKAAATTAAATAASSAAETNSRESSQVSEGESSSGNKKRKEQELDERHVEVRAMNIPMSLEHESDESSLCLLEQTPEDNVSGDEICGWTSDTDKQTDELTNLHFQHINRLLALTHSVIERFSVTYYVSATNAYNEPRKWLALPFLDGVASYTSIIFFPLLE